MYFYMSDFNFSQWGAPKECECLDDDEPVAKKAKSGNLGTFVCIECIELYLKGKQKFEYCHIYRNNPSSKLRHINKWHKSPNKKCTIVVKASPRVTSLLQDSTASSKSNADSSPAPSSSSCAATIPDTLAPPGAHVLTDSLPALSCISPAVTNVVSETPSTSNPSPALPTSQILEELSSKLDRLLQIKEGEFDHNNTILLLLLGVYFLKMGIISKIQQKYISMYMHNE